MANAQYYNVQNLVNVVLCRLVPYGKNGNLNIQVNHIQDNHITDNIIKANIIKVNIIKENIMENIIKEIKRHVIKQELLVHVDVV